jgi:AcrR family transcriptional regulator
VATATITRDDVVDAAMGLMRGGGVGALSMRRLAEEVGTSYQVVYSRVGGKAEVVRALHDRGFAAWVTATSTLPTVPGTAEHVHETARQYLRAALDDPLTFALMFATPVPEFRRDEAARTVEWEAFRTCWLAPVGAYLDATVDERPPGTTRRLAWRLWSAVHGITTVHLAGHDSPSGDPEAEVVGMVRLLLADPIASGAA